MSSYEIPGPPQIHLFDPKYKIAQDGGPKKEDIDKMHAYRDAIRGPHLSRVVGTATILYPGPDRLYEDGICAMSAVPGTVTGMLLDRLHAILRPVAERIEE